MTKVSYSQLELLTFIGFQKDSRIHFSLFYSFTYNYLLFSSNKNFKGLKTNPHYQNNTKKYKERSYRKIPLSKDKTYRITQPHVNEACNTQHSLDVCVFSPIGISIHKSTTVKGQFTISWATSSGTSLSKSKENSIASLSLYFPFNFLISSIRSHNLIAIFSPSSSSANSTRTPVSSWKKAWFKRSLMEYLSKKKKIKKKKSLVWKDIFLSFWDSISYVAQAGLRLTEHLQA